MPRDLHSFPTRRSSDLVGACVGMRGSRVKNIVRELNNEKVDIIRWSSDPKDYVLEALKPAKVKNLVFDTEKKSVQISRSEEHTSELQSRFDLVCRLLLE